MDHEDKEHAALMAFNELWKSKFAHDSLLVFSTGRSHHLYEELRVGSPFKAPLSMMDNRRSMRKGQRALCKLLQTD